MFTNDQFAFVAKQHMDTIYRVAYGWLRNSDDANDVTQEVLLKLYNADMVFESDAHIKNWLIRVTFNQCKMLFRAPWRNTEAIEDYADTLGFEEKEYSDIFENVMNLEKKYRIPLLLFYYEGYSTAEIASILNLPQNTVSTRLFRARAKLKKCLEED